MVGGQGSECASIYDKLGRKAEAGRRAGDVPPPHLVAAAARALPASYYSSLVTMVARKAE